MHIGDIDADGFPDILVTILYNNGSSIPHILLNQELPPSHIPKTGLSDAEFKRLEKELQDARKMSKNRFFNLNVTQTRYHKVLHNYQHSKLAVFTDMIENSMLDFLVISDTSQITPIYNNLQGEMFFIKSRMISEEKAGSPVRQATFRAVLTSLNDEKFVVQGSDPGQSTYGALSIPNVMIGVGRSNNFVEMFTVSVY